MIPAAFVPILFALITSGIMSFLVSGIATWKALGLITGFFGTWMSAWSVAWAVAFPTLLIVGPAVRRLLARNSR